MWPFPQRGHDLSVVLPKMSTFLDIDIRKLGLQLCSLVYIEGIMVQEWKTYQWKAYWEW